MCRSLTLTPGFHAAMKAVWLCKEVTRPRLLQILSPICPCQYAARRKPKCGQCRKVFEKPTPRRLTARCIRHQAPAQTLHRRVILPANTPHPLPPSFGINQKTCWRLHSPSAKSLPSRSARPGVYSLQVAVSAT